MTISNEVDEFLRSKLNERLSQVTDKQRRVFDKIWPQGPKADQLVSAINLCDRTLLNNLKREPSP